MRPSSSLYLGVDEQTAIVVRHAAIRRQKRHGPLWVDFVGLSGGDLCERTGESLDRRESRVRFGSVVGVEQVKVDVGARGLKLGWINTEQDTA